MLAEKEPLTVLVVSGTDKGREYLCQLLPKGSDTGAVTSAKSAGEARRILLSKPFDLVLINTPLSDEYGSELAVSVCEDSGAGVMLLVKSESYEMVADKVEELGVLTVAKPASRQSITQSLSLLRSTRARMRRVERENEKLKNKMEEVRVVSRAKWALIENEHLSEAEAHRKIEKLAMDRRLARKNVAEEIISLYQN